MKPLAGLQVLDLTRVLAGPLCAQYLGDLGADVIKIEPCVDGDDTRHWPPFRGTTGTVFLSANRSKRSLALDLKEPSGRAVLHRLIERADVLIESFGPGVAPRLGVDPDTTRSLNPRLIHCSISGFGPEGPMSTRKGYDVILQAFSGMMSITGDDNGPPSRSPFSPVDQATGFHTISGVLAALMERERSGVGSLVETSLFDTAIAFLGYFFQGYWEQGRQPARAGSGHESLCPYQAFQTADHFILLGVANDALWRSFCSVAGLLGMADDQRFRTNADRVAHRAACVGMVQSVLIARPRDEWLTLCAQAGVPAAPIHSFEEVDRHPHTQASGIVTEVVHPAYGVLKTVALPILFNGQRCQPSGPPPMLGEHTDAILAELGYDAEAIAALKQQQAVHAAESIRS